MSGEKKINVEVKKNWGITQALAKLVEQASGGSEKVKMSVWQGTIDKIVELNNQRKADNKGSIFTGGTDRKDYHGSFVVHEGNLEFSEAEMSILLDAMDVSDGIKKKILGKKEELTREQIDEKAKKAGYRKTNHTETYYDDKTKKHYRWDNESGTFKELGNVKKINSDGSYVDNNGKEYNADGTEKVAGGAQPPAGGAGEGKPAAEGVVAKPVGGFTPNVLTVDEKGRPLTAHQDCSYSFGAFNSASQDFRYEYNEDGSYKVHITHNNAKFVGNALSSDKITDIYEYDKDGKELKWTFKAGDDYEYVNDKQSGITTDRRGHRCTETKITENGRTETFIVEGKTSSVTEFDKSGKKLNKKIYNTDTQKLDTEIIYNSDNNFKRYRYDEEENKLSREEGTADIDGNVITSIKYNIENPDENVSVYVNLDPGIYGTSETDIGGLTPQEAKDIQAKLLELKGFYDELVSEGISEERQGEIAAKLTEIIKDENARLEMKQAAAYVAYFVKADELYNAIYETKDPAIINRICYLENFTDYNKLLELSKDKEFRAKDGYNDIYESLLYYAPNEIRFKAFTQLPKTWDVKGAKWNVPSFDTKYITEHIDEIKTAKEKFVLYAKSSGKIDKKTFDEIFLPTVPKTPDGQDVDMIQAVINKLPEEDRGSYHLVKSGDRFYNIIRDKILADPSIVGLDFSDYSDKKRNMVINKYIQDNSKTIATQLGIEDIEKLYPGKVLDFSKVEWKKADVPWYYFIY